MNKFYMYLETYFKLSIYVEALTYMYLETYLKLSIYVEALVSDLLKSIRHSNRN